MFQSQKMIKITKPSCMGLSYECIYYATGEHPSPYFEHKATVDIRTCEIIESDLPKKQTKLVIAWAELHQDERMANRAL
jgi:hypothetical protein